MPSDNPAVVRLTVTKFRTKTSDQTLTDLLRHLTSDLYFGTKKADRILWDAPPALSQKRARGHS